MVNIKLLIIPVVSLVATVSVLIIIAVQYPLSVSFPMGGDTPPYIIIAKQYLKIFSDPLVAWGAFNRSWYPLSYVLFLLTAVLPIDWPMRFVWWAALGQIASGLALAWYMYKIGGWRTAAASMAVWAILPITALRHFEDGTIAQLWSYVFVFLFFERLHANSRWLALLFFMATLLSHPITGLVLFSASVVSFAPLWFVRRRLPLVQQKTINFFAVSLIIISIILAFLFFDRRNIFSFVESVSAPELPLDYISSRFVALLLFIPVGFVSLYKLLRRSTTFVLTLSFCVVALMLSYNYYLLGVSVWSIRLYPYFVLAVCLLLIPAIPDVIGRVFTKPFTRIVFVTLALIMLTVTIWERNIPFYNFYEYAGNYARLHADELLAIEWMRDNLPAGSRIISTSANRNTEWIPALTEHVWVAVGDTTVLLSDAKYENDYFVYFLNREDIPAQVLDVPTKYPRIYQNENAVIITAHSLDKD